MPRAHAVVLDAEREIGDEADRLTRSGRVGRVAAPVDERPRRRRAAVVERRLADELDLDAALEAFDRSNEHVVGVVVGRRPRVRRDRVLVIAGPMVSASRTTTQPDGVFHVVTSTFVPGSYVARRRMVDPERREAEEPGLPVEQAAEDARGVEARNAEPVDRAVRRDQGAGVAVGEEGIVRDRWERRGSGGALLACLGCRRRVAHAVTQGPCQRPWPATSLSAAAGPHVPGA